MKTPDRDFRITFRSIPMSDPADAWEVWLRFPANSTAETLLPLEAMDGTETPIAAGSFDFMGCRCALADGRGTLRYADFIAGLRETTIWLLRPGRQPVPGALTFV